MIPPDRVTMPDWLDTAAQAYPDRLALAFGGERWTFAALRHAVDAGAVVLQRAHIARAVRVGILAANRPGFVHAVHAARRLGAEIVPLNWRQTADELAWQLRDADVRVLVADPERRETAATASAGLPVTILPVEEIEQAPPATGGSRPAPTIDLAQEAAVLYTSGTTNRPKGVRLTHGNFWFSAVGSALHLGHRADDAWLQMLPLFHVGGLSILLRSVIGGTPVILHDRFDPDRANAALDEGATLVSVVPVMLQRLIDARGDLRWPASLRTVLLGGSGASPALIAECLERGIPVAPTYGLTETASQVATLLPADVARKPGSSGLPLPVTQVRITGPEGGVAPGDSGQIEVRGPTLCAGYLNRDGPSPMTADGWFQTGDLGYRDDDGYLFVVERRDDLIVSGGENISPAEIERVLLAHPAVADAGVVGIPDETWGARPVAAVVWRGEPDAAEALLLAYCRDRLAAYKLPQRVLVRDELPRSASGKLLRRTLRELILEAFRAERR